MIVAVTAMLAVVVGCVVVTTALLAILVSQIADLKAYTMTQIGILQNIDTTTSEPKRKLLLRIHRIVKLCQAIR